MFLIGSNESSQWKMGLLFFGRPQKQKRHWSYLSLTELPFVLINSPLEITKDPIKFCLSSSTRWLTKADKNQATFLVFIWAIFFLNRKDPLFFKKIRFWIKFMRYKQTNKRLFTWKSKPNPTPIFQTRKSSGPFWDLESLWTSKAISNQDFFGSAFFERKEIINRTNF